MTSFYAGNAKTILIAKQSDESTPVADFTDAIALRVYEWTKNPIRSIAPLLESDASVQASASHVTAITPSISFGVYGRPSELDLIAEALLGANDDTATGPPYTHTATPDQDTPYYSILEVNEYGTVRYEGCRAVSATFTAQDSGETELKVTGLTWLAKSTTNGFAAPEAMPAPADEAPFIFAEATIKYSGSSAGRTSAFTWNVNRNAVRAQGDAGFTALAIVNGKLQNDGSVTRYLADDATIRAVDTGTTGGTTPTTDIFSESFSVGFSRAAGAVQFLAATQEIAYQTDEVALNLDGAPFAEVLGFAHQPQATLADNITIITVNAKATPEG